MSGLLALLGVAVALCIHGRAEARFVGVTFFGELWEVDEATGAARLIGDTGFEGLNSLAMASDALETLCSAAGDTLVTIDPETGAASPVATLDFGSDAVSVRSLAFGSDGALYAINFAPPSFNDLFRIDPETGASTFIGRGGNPAVHRGHSMIAVVFRQATSSIPRRWATNNVPSTSLRRHTHLLH